MTRIIILIAALLIVFILAISILDMAPAHAEILAVGGTGYTPAQESRVRTVDAMATRDDLPPMVVHFADLGPGAAGTTSQDFITLVTLSPSSGYDMGEVYAHETGHQWGYRLGSYARLQWKAKVGGNDSGGWGDYDEALAQAVARLIYGTWVPWRPSLPLPSDYRTWLAYQWDHASWPDVAGEDAELVTAGVWVRQHGLMYGLETGSFGSWSYLTRRQVYLVMVRASTLKWMPVPYQWRSDYTLCSRDDLAAAWPGLNWQGGTTATYITRSAFARLLYRARIGG